MESVLAKCCYKTMWCAVYINKSGRWTVDSPRIRQNNFLASSSCRCALALLHRHQITNISEDSLEVCHVWVVLSRQAMKKK